MEIISNITTCRICNSTNLKNVISEDEKPKTRKSNIKSCFKYARE